MSTTPLKSPVKTFCTDAPLRVSKKVYYAPSTKLSVFRKKDAIQSPSRKLTFSRLRVENV